jgi:cellulose synthase/poly-beta-1,6-N-acetylglucosamine synthase-like glycosyltransferase
MPLKGHGDASKAIEGILGQSHQQLELSVIVDSDDDQVASSARKALSGRTNTKIKALDDRSNSCSLVCSAHLQTLKQNPNFEGVVTFAAGDTQWHSQWLQMLLDGLAEPGVGATLGNRWYVSSKAGWGALTRRHWNAVAISAMWFMEIPWAGAMAIRTEVLEQTGIPDIWGKAMIEDVSIVSTLRQHGLKFRHIPDCVAVETGEVGMSEAVAFIGRQNLWARLYHPAWLLLLTHAILGVITLLAPLVLVILAILAGSTSGVIVGVSAGLIYIGSLFILLLCVEADINKTLFRTGQQQQQWSLRAVLRSLVSIPMTQILHAYTVVRAHFAREVNWSGVRYEIEGPLNVRMKTNQGGRSGPEPNEDEESS